MHFSSFPHSLSGKQLHCGVRAFLCIIRNITFFFLSNACYRDYPLNIDPSPNLSNISYFLHHTVDKLSPLSLSLCFSIDNSVVCVFCCRNFFVLKQGRIFKAHLLYPPAIFFQSRLNFAIETNVNLATLTAVNATNLV